MYRRLLVACLVFLIAITAAGRTAHSASCQLSPEEEKAVRDAEIRLTQANVIRGGPTTLDPDRFYSQSTRAIFAVTLVNALGWELPPHPGPDLPFSDMKDHWAGPAVSLLYQAGIVAGFGDGTFRPDESIQLDHAKIMLARLLRASPSVTGENVDESLRKAGIDLDLPCSGGPDMLQAHHILLLDRTLSVPLYVRNR